MKNLVMGVATNYAWQDLEPFVTSCKQNCPDTDLVLFVGNISDFTRKQLLCGGCTKLVDIPAELKNVLVIHSRWKMYLDFLQAHGDDYAQVFITDTRDVIFQGDVFSPFKERSNWLAYTTEADDIGGSKTGDKVNYRWLVDCFGKAAADKLVDKKIICCGTIISSVNTLKIFSRIMWDALKADTVWGHE